MWTSKTGQFDAAETSRLETMPAAQLAAALIGSGPVVALRALTEVRLNGDTSKLHELLRNQALTAYWRGYAGDFGLDGKEPGYARELEAILATL